MYAITSSKIHHSDLPVHDQNYVQSAVFMALIKDTRNKNTLTFVASSCGGFDMRWLNACGRIVGVAGAGVGVVQNSNKKQQLRRICGALCKHIWTNCRCDTSKCVGVVQKAETNNNTHVQRPLSVSLFVRFLLHELTLIVCCSNSRE